MNKIVSPIVIPLLLLVYLSTIMAPYAGTADISRPTAETIGVCGCAIKEHSRLACYCQHMEHKRNTGPEGDSFQFVQSSFKPTVLARYCSCGVGKATALPGLEGFDHLLSRICHDVMWDEAYFPVPCDPLLQSRMVEPPERPPPEYDNGRCYDSVGGADLPRRTGR
jgi:hypothetical protein